MKYSDKIFVAGHQGLVGSGIVRYLNATGHRNLVLRTRAELDLTDTMRVHDFFKRERPSHVFMSAARVGGILANNNYPADFIRENLLVQTSILDAAHAADVEKLVFLGSSCVYPRHAAQPIREESLLTGPLEPTNEPYAISKIAGIVQCQSFNRQHGTRYISLMPTNIYGEHDNFHRTDSHVLPSLMRRFHEARVSGAAEVVVWGSGIVRREFLHSDDLAHACVHLMNVWGEPGPDGVPIGGMEAVNQIVNVGYGEDVSIRELASIVSEIVGFAGRIIWDASKPDGMPRKLLDSARLRSTGWRPVIDLRDGIARTFRWFVANYPKARLG